MPARHRKPDNFDPNKSDSDDENFEDKPVRSPRKPSRKPNSKKSRRVASTKSRSVRKYKGSDIDDDDDISDSLMEDSQSSETEQSEPEIDEVTGRRKRKAAQKAKYQEPDDDEGLEALKDEDSSDSEMHAPASKKLRLTRAVTPPESIKPERLIIKLRLPSTISAKRTTRAASTTRNTRHTRATTQDPLVGLSESGHHAIQSTRDPEEVPPEGRRKFGSKSVPVDNTTLAEVDPDDMNNDTRSHATSHFEREIPQTQEDDMVQDVEDELPVDMDAASDTPLVESDVREVATVEDDEDDDEDAIPLRRSNRASKNSTTIEASIPADDMPSVAPITNRRITRGGAARNKGLEEATSDYDPDEAEATGDNMSASEASPRKVRAETETDTGSPRRKGGALRRGGGGGKGYQGRRKGSTDTEDEIDHDELQEEAAELKNSRRRRPMRVDDEIAYEERKKRVTKPVDYKIQPMDAIYAADEDAEDAVPATARRANNRRAGASQPWERNLHTAYGPFGGADGAAPVIGGPWGTGAAGGADSDSSDDDALQRPVNGAGATPTTGGKPGLLQHNNPTDPTGTGVHNFGKIKSQKALADADPLGVDENVDFSKVGGLAEHINQLKEMVQIPLLYPELFLQYNVTPPRGVLFHGPPGTGKTLLARALAAQVGAGGKKITFYMRKGADALSKWVGEAEKQLRLLFDEARKTQPSIIFFDEIDGLAPVRSSKQEQIHASIVSTLLALMDGMDGRGQVIVIGATNRPDNIDPALRRPGRFDREFYFPLPDVEGRKSIINIHTRDWGINDAFKDNLAAATKGYGGADLRALCTEAALNSMQRTYPQIYSSNEKLIVDPKKIKITAKDFMLSIKKLVPSSDRAASGVGAKPLPKVIEPLLREQLQSITSILDDLIPTKKKTTALEEAMYEQFDDDEDAGFGRETLLQEFEKSRVYRPRLLIGGQPGMGQTYLASAILHHFEGLHVQNFDLPTIFADSTRSPETAMVQLFAEVKRHKPSVIFLPGIDTWYHTLGESVITTFLGLLRAIPPSDPILLLGICDSEPRQVDPHMLQELFGYSQKNQFLISRPTKECRIEFFKSVIGYIKTAPKDFPDSVNRKKRKLEVLEVAPPPPPKVLSKEEVKALKKKDHQLLNLLKVHLQPIMDQIQKKYRKLRAPAIPQATIQYLYDEQDVNFVNPDVAGAQHRPFELSTDKLGNRGLVETATGKFYYNLETTTIEERLANGYYCRPLDFLWDIKTLAKDARNLGERERLLKTRELQANVEVDTMTLQDNPIFADCENVYHRQLQRTKEKDEKAKKRAELESQSFPLVQSDVATNGGPMLLDHPFQLSQPLNQFGSPGTSNSQQSFYSHGLDIHAPPTSGVPPASQDFISQWQRNNIQNSNGTSPNLSSAHRGPRNFHPILNDASPQSVFDDTSATPSGNHTNMNHTSDYTNGDTSRLPIDLFNDVVMHDVTDSQLSNTQRVTGTDSSSDRRKPHFADVTPNRGDEPWYHSQADALRQGLIPGSASQASTTTQPSQNPPIPTSNPTPTPNSTSDKTTTSTSTRSTLHLPPKLADILAPITTNPSSQASSEKDLIGFDSPLFAEALTELTEKSSGCSIEQLEQINREVMCEIWRLRGEWNRLVVLTKVLRVFNDTIGDIEEMRGIGACTQDTQGAGGG